MRQSFFRKSWWDKIPQNYCEGDKKAWRSLADQVKARDGFRCTECGAPGKQIGGIVELQACHIISKSKNGSDSLNNLITKCRDCHAKEHSHMRL
jgi:5-methylcytosine-specific restriction endonuclease McrA